MIALSAHSGETVVSAARQAGVSDFLVKPVEPLDLIRALNAQLRGWQAGAMAPTTSSAGRSLLDLAWLDSLRRVGLIKEDLARALDEIGAKLEKLASHLADDDLTQAKALLHALLGLTGQLGAKAIYEEVHAQYALMMETERWPEDQDWLVNLRQLFADTDRVLRAQTKR